MQFLALGLDTAKSARGQSGASEARTRQLQAGCALTPLGSRCEVIRAGLENAGLQQKALREALAADTESEECGNTPSSRDNLLNPHPPRSQGKRQLVGLGARYGLGERTA